MSEVKRYDAVHIRYEDNNIRYGEGCEVEVVTARDYAALEAERERLREALGGMLEVYGGERDADGLPKHEVELNLIAFASAALAASTGQEVDGGS